MLPFHLKCPVATSKTMNLSECLEITHFVARTRETLTRILHTIIFDSNTTYFVWPLYLLMCMGVGQEMANQNDRYIRIQYECSVKCNDRHLRCQFYCTEEESIVCA